MKHIGLFEGIGGFSYAARQLGWETIAMCEINPFCIKVLNKHWPNTIIHGDIKQTDFTIYRGKCDILTGGFPCQDLSIAGGGIGITGERSSLWFEMYRAINEIRPSFVVIENSPELLKKGFEKVLYPLSEIGYDAEWQCVESHWFGGQQQRERVYVIAYSENVRLQRGILGPVFWKRVLSQPVMRVSPGWKDRWDIPSPRNFRSTHEVSNLVDRIKSLGNSIDTEVAIRIFKAIDMNNQLCDGCNVRGNWGHRCHGESCNCDNPVCMERQGKITFEQLMQIVNKELKDKKEINA